MAKKKSAKKVAPPRVPVPPRQPSLSSDFVSMDALYQAYRKAKVDVFYERSQPLSQEFCEYERNLHANLTALQATLTQPGADWFKRIEFIGKYGFIPKGLQIPEPEGDQDSAAHFSVSNLDHAWEAKLRTLKGEKPIAEFRPVALFTVQMHVVSALWVNLVGHMFDACLDGSARGSRLRRLAQSGEELPECGSYHLTAPGSFKPYFNCYREWREKGLHAIRTELAEDRSVVAITMDLKSFYHNVDPRFILEKTFLNAVRFSHVNGRGLALRERTFTRQVVAAFVNWAKSLPHLDEEMPPGIPVGGSAPQIIANVLLAEFDRLVQQTLDPIYYSRYVDDIFLVLRDNGRMSSSRDVLNHLCRRIKPLKANKDLSELTLAFPYSKNCRLLFQAKKQRVFLLSGEEGADLLDTIESQIDAVSSEWRLLPDLDALQRSPAAKVLTATRRADENADTLRKADQLSLKRLSFSIMLRQYDMLAHDLPPNEWERERKRFYRFAECQVLTPLRLLDLNDYLPRLLGLAVSCQDWTVAAGFLKRISNGIAQLRKNVTVEPSAGADSQWDGYLRHLQTALREAVVRSYPLSQDNPFAEHAVESLLDAIDALNPGIFRFSQDASTLSRELFWTDLGRFPFKNALLGYIPLPPCTLHPWEGELPQSQMERLSVIREFLSGAETTEIKLRPLLFPTRPFSPREVTEFDCRSAWDLDRLRDYVVALRGTWVKPVAHTSRVAEAVPAPDGGSPSKTREVLVVGDGNRKHAPRIAITSFLTEESSWAKAAEGTPELSAERYKRLVRLANAVVTSPHRAEYVVFPELSIPRRWLPGLAGLFMKAGTSLITGVEYRRVPPEPATQVVNEAYLVLADDRLGYRSWCVVRQQKGVPAHHERDELRGKFGLTLAAPASKDDPKPIYRHFGHDFGVLICSELTDIRFRQEMRGDVDTLFVLSWNQDLDSFGALVEAAVLDVHCYMVLVNNRKFGDSRVRAPSKKTWMRDLVRIKGGLDDYFVVTELDIMSLRNFQSYHEPPLGDDAAFKPTPEGFKIAKRRKQTPGDAS